MIIRAKKLLAADEYKSAINRGNYAIFHAINAIHTLKGNAYKRHKVVIGSLPKFGLRHICLLCVLSISCSTSTG